MGEISLLFSLRSMAKNQYLLLSKYISLHTHLTHQMKISKKDFQEMQKKYQEEVGQGKPGKNPKGEVSHQTDWIFFDRETLQKILDQADQDGKTGGIKFYFTEYSESLAKKWHPEDPDAYCGSMTLVLKAANLINGNPMDVELTNPGDPDFENNGIKCPPSCK